MFRKTKAYVLLQKLYLTVFGVFSGCVITCLKSDMWTTTVLLSSTPRLRGIAWDATLHGHDIMHSQYQLTDDAADARRQTNVVRLASLHHMPYLSSATTCNPWSMQNIFCTAIPTVSFIHDSDGSECLQISVGSRVEEMTNELTFKVQLDKLWGVGPNIYCLSRYKVQFGQGYNISKVRAWH